VHCNAQSGDHPGASVNRTSGQHCSSEIIFYKTFVSKAISSTLFQNKFGERFGKN
jgi:hypothetical protein